MIMPKLSILQREADFLERIAARRASSYSKFEDDYYGENIKNLSDYRQWLREQQKKQRMAEKYDSKEQEKEVNTEAAWERKLHKLNQHSLAWDQMKYQILFTVLQIPPFSLISENQSVDRWMFSVFAVMLWRDLT